MHADRRRFLYQTAGLAAALGATGATESSLLQAAETQPTSAPAGLPIVDTHQHLWDLSKIRLPWLAGSGALNRSFVTKDYLEATQGLNVVKAVYMEVDADPAQLVDEAQYVIDICRRGDAPTCAAVIGGRPGSEGFRDYITKFKDNRFVKGVRQIFFGSGDGPSPFLEKTFVNGVRLLGELGMCFDLCTSPGLFDQGIKLVDQCPGTRIVLDHCGNADVKWFRAARKDGDEAVAAKRSIEQWRRNIAVLAERKNVVCKISGIIATVPKDGWTPDDLAPIVNHCLDSFGPDRVMFAGDWPVCTQGAPLRRWIEVLRQIVGRRPEADQRKLFAGNAVRFYGLE